MSAYVYILCCADGSLYTGWTTDPQKRVRLHNEGKAAKYTRGRLPVSLAFLEACSGREEALQREHEIKRMSRSAKLRLCERK